MRGVLSVAVNNALSARLELYDRKIRWGAPKQRLRNIRTFLA